MSFFSTVVRLWIYSGVKVSMTDKVHCQNNLKKNRENGKMDGLLRSDMKGGR